MTISKFLEEENIQLLWEVLIDEPLIKELCNSEIKIKNLMQLFQSNIRGFFSTEKNNCNNLIELNKKYILLIINYLIKVEKSDNTAQYKKIKIHVEEPIKESITYEDIHNDRMTLFEKELNKKQEEFTSAMSFPVPPVPNFSDNMDKPITEIELEIKRIQEQRNYDIEIIANTNKNTSLPLDTNWLTPQETSLKNEKLFINIDKNDNNIKKHISWEDEQSKYSQEETNIFNKLKKVDNSDHNNAVANLFQSQIDEIKKDLLSLNEKIDLILQKI
jgi:hypothetical protein